MAVPSGLPDATLADAERAGVRVTRFLVEPDGKAMALIAALLETGDVEVVVAEVFALANVSDAHEKSRAGRTRGRLVLSVSHDG